MPYFRADDVVSVVEEDKGYAGVSFLDWKFKAKPLETRSVRDPSAYSGPGLYGLCFDDELIYIGSFLGAGKTSGNAGDVVSLRWWTHLGSITARSYNLSIAKRNLEFAAELLEDDSEIRSALMNEGVWNLLSKDRGNLCPLRRLQFADANRTTFIGRDVRPQSVLDRFSFTYVKPNYTHDGADELAVRKRVIDAERRLIESFAPSCNTKHVPPGAVPVRLNVRELEGVLRSSLETTNGAAPTLSLVKSSTVPETLSVEETDAVLSTHFDQEIEPDLTAEEWSGLFWSRLPKDDGSPKAIVDCLRGLALRYDAREVYTGKDNGDLRFKWGTVSGPERVFIRLTWRPKLKKFVVFALCSPEIVRSNVLSLGLSDEVWETSLKESQKSEIHVPGELSRIQLFREIFLCSLAAVKRT